VDLPTTQLLTYRDVQARLRVSRETVRQMVLRGDLSPIQIGPQAVRFEEVDLQALIERRRRRRMPDAA
jgi:excisionase family DNA binding protein